MENHKEFIKYLINKGGPEEEDYIKLDLWANDISKKVETGQLLKNEVSQIRSEFDETFSNEAMLGLAYLKPHGYAGDYEVIDRIYQRYISEQPHLTKWDVYWQKLTAADAVRNRVGYFNLLLASQDNNNLENKTLSVLNIASGPGRDMLYFFDNNLNADVLIDCVEQDQNAIEYASSLCEEHIHKINFIKKNAMRFKTEKKYHLVWSAGLFDYFDDKVFVYMLKKLKGMIEKSGEIVIGNFSTSNPSKPFMEIFEWHLYHRSPDKLKKLAYMAGFDSNKMSVKKEESGVNLFLHLKVYS